MWKKNNNSNISTKVRNWQSLLYLVPALQLELGSSMHEDDTIANFNSFDILQAMIILFLINELRSFDIYCYWYCCCWPKFMLHSSGSIFRGEQSVSIRVKKRDNCCCPQLTYSIYGLCTACVDTCRKSGKKNTRQRALSWEQVRWSFSILIQICWENAFSLSLSLSQLITNRKQKFQT